MGRKILAFFICMLIVLISLYFYNYTREMTTSYRFSSDGEVIEEKYINRRNKQAYTEFLEKSYYIEKYDHTVPPLKNFLDVEVETSGGTMSLEKFLNEDQLQYRVKVVFSEMIEEELAHTGRLVWDSKSKGYLKVYILIHGMGIEKTAGINLDSKEIINYNQEANLERTTKRFFPKSIIIDKSKLD